MFHLQIVSEQWLRLACKWLVSHWGQLLSRTRSPCHFSMETLSEKHTGTETRCSKESLEGSEILQRLGSSLEFHSQLCRTRRPK